MGSDHYQVTVTIDQGTLAREATVVNRKPTITQATIVGTRQGATTQAALTVGWMDPAIGITEVFSVSVDWGDSAPPTLVGGLTARTLSTTHLYAANGTYRVVITVADDDGGSVARQVHIEVADGSIEQTQLATG